MYLTTETLCRIPGRWWNFETSYQPTITLLRCQPWEKYPTYFSRITFQIMLIGQNLLKSIIFEVYTWIFLSQGFIRYLIEINEKNFNSIRRIFLIRTLFCGPNRDFTIYLLLSGWNMFCRSIFLLKIWTLESLWIAT